MIMADPSVASDVVSTLLSAKNGVWALVIMVVAREFIRALRDKTGPQWVRNGAMDHILDGFTLRLQAALRDSSKDLHEISKDIHEMLRKASSQQNLQSESLRKILLQHDKYEGGWDQMVENQAVASKALRAIAEEFTSDTRLCVYNHDQAARIHEQNEKRKAGIIKTRRDDLNLEEKKK